MERRRSWRERGLSLVVLVLASGALGGCGDVRDTAVAVGHTAPAYGALTLAGDSVYLSDLEGRVILLNVWATWCPPCREEIPDLQELYEAHADRGLEIVGVSVDGRGEAPAIERFADDYGVTYTLWHDPDDIISTRYRLIGVPATFLIDRDGVIRWLHLGPVRFDDPALNSALEAALAES